MLVWAIVSTFHFKQAVDPALIQQKWSHWKAEVLVIRRPQCLKVSLSYLVLMWPGESSVTSHLLHPHNKNWTHKTLNPRNSDQYSYVWREEKKIFHKISLYSDTSSLLTLRISFYNKKRQKNLNLGWKVCGIRCDSAQLNWKSRVTWHDQLKVPSSHWNNWEIVCR